MGIACGLARQTSNRSSGKCRVSCTRGIRYFILFHSGLLIRHFSLTFSFSPSLPPSRLKFFAIRFADIQRGWKRMLSLSLCFSSLFFFFFLLCFAVKIDSQSSCFCRPSKRLPADTKGIKFLKMRSGVADTLSTDDSWTDVDGKYFFRSIQFMLRYYWNGNGTNHKVSSLLLLNEEKSMRIPFIVDPSIMD